MVHGKKSKPWWRSKTSQEHKRGWDHAIIKIATSASKMPQASSIWRHLPFSRHPVVSRETIWSRLTDSCKRRCHPLKSLQLTQHHGQCCLDFYGQQASRSVTIWRHVIFSDESRFILNADDHRTRIGRQTGQRTNPSFSVKRRTEITQNITVWGGIYQNIRSRLVVLQPTMTTHSYVDRIWGFQSTLCQQDNVCPHT